MGLGGLRKVIVGRSGVYHSFDEVEFDEVDHHKRARMVSDFRDEVNESDVIAFYSKMIDVGARSGELRAPRFADGARKLAAEYGIHLTSVSQDAPREKRETDVKTAQLVQLLCEIGPDIPEIARRLGQFKESVRYRYREKILERGFAVQAMADHEKLGLKRVVVISEFAEAYKPYSHAILTSMNELCYVVSFAKIIPSGLYKIEASVPEEFIPSFIEFIHKLKEKGLFRSVRTFQFDWVRNPPMRAEFFDFKTGRWDYDWSSSTNTNFDSASFGPCQKIGFDYSDLLILKELQVDASRSLVEITKKLGMNYKKLAWHYSTHVLRRGLLKGYRLNWIGTRYDQRIERALHRMHTYVPIELLAWGLGVVERQELASKVNKLPFIWLESSGPREYYAQLVFPIDSIIEALQYLEKLISPLRERVEYFLMDQSSSLSFTFSYQLYDQERKTWVFDEASLLTRFERLIMEIKRGAG